MGLKLFIGLKWLIALSLLIFGTMVSIRSQDAGFIATPAVVIESSKAYGLKGSPDRLPTLSMHFSYRYRFNDREYTSSRVRHGFLNKAKGVAQFPAGSAITIYMNPDKPEYAVIQKGLPTVFYMIILSGVVMLANLLFEARIRQLDRIDKSRPGWLESAYNFTGPIVAASFLSTAIILLFS